MLGSFQARLLVSMVVAAFAGGALGCGAQSDNFDDRDWTKQHGLQGGQAWREVETLFGEGESDVDRFGTSLRGVRHDLTFKDDVTADTRCTCLEVAIGEPADSRFVWAGRRPTISGANMVIALRTEGSACPAAAANRRPSIQAVDVTGSNVTVVIEELTFDRPQALGAIIRKPGAAGGLFVRASDKRSLYGRTIGGKNSCRIKTTQHSHHQQIRSGRRY